MLQAVIINNIDEINNWLDKVDVENGGNDNAIELAIEQLEYLESLLKEESA